MGDAVQAAAQQTTPVAEFFQFLRDFKSVFAIIGKLAVLAPLADIALAIGPPWPTRGGVSTLVCIVQLVILMYAFEFWSRKRSGRMAGVRGVMRYAIAGCAVTFAAHIVLFALLVEDYPDRWHRVVAGIQLHPDIAEMARGNPSLYTRRYLLELFGGDPTRVWAPWSVYAARVCLLATWLSFWCCLSAVVASFVAIQWRRQQRAKRQAG